MRATVRALKWLHDHQWVTLALTVAILELIGLALLPAGAMSFRPGPLLALRVMRLLVLSVVIYEIIAMLQFVAISYLSVREACEAYAQAHRRFVGLDKHWDRMWRRLPAILLKSVGWIEAGLFVSLAGAATVALWVNSLLWHTISVPG